MCKLLGTMGKIIGMVFISAGLTIGIINLIFGIYFGSLAQIGSGFTTIAVMIVLILQQRTMKREDSLINVFVGER